MPPFRYKDKFVKLEEEAKEAKRGIGQLINKHNDSAVLINRHPRHQYASQNRELIDTNHVDCQK